VNVLLKERRYDGCTRSIDLHGRPRFNIDFGPDYFSGLRRVEAAAMTDYQPTEQDKVLLDYAQTRHDIGPLEANKLFEYWDSTDKTWNNIIGVHHCAAGILRRKPRTVTLKYGKKEWELPVPDAIEPVMSDLFSVLVKDVNERDQWLAALREIAGGEKE
jgi:hypothetical protein